MGTEWLRGRTAVVTGASRGIGRGIAEALARAGVRVVLAARSDDVLNEVAATLRDEGCDVRTKRCDVASTGDVDALFDDVTDVDVLVCAAGILEKATIDETTPELWDQTIATNLTGSFLCCRRAFASMRAPAEDAS